MIKKIMYLICIILFFISTNCYASLITTTGSTNITTTGGIQLVTTDEGIIISPVNKTVLDLMLDLFD